MCCQWQGDNDTDQGSNNKEWDGVCNTTKFLASRQNEDEEGQEWREIHDEQDPIVISNILTIFV